MCVSLTRMRSSSIIIIAVFLVYQIYLNAGDNSGNCTLKPISTNNTAMIDYYNITVLDDDNNTCIVDNKESSCTLSDECISTSCVLLLLNDTNDGYCNDINDSCIVLSNGSNCTINFLQSSATTSSLTALSSSITPPSSSSILISPSIFSSPITTSMAISTSQFISSVPSSTNSMLSLTASSTNSVLSSTFSLKNSVPSLTISSSTVSTSESTVPESTVPHTSSQTPSSPSATVQPTFQLSDLIEEPYIYYWPPGLAFLMLMCCTCIICLILCTWIRSWKSKMHAYKFVIAHDCGIQDLKYIDLPSRNDKVEFTTFKNLSKLDNEDDEKETDLEAGATGEFGEGIPRVIITESEPITDLETAALITGEDNENTDEENKKEKKEDAKDEAKDTNESKQQETGGTEVSIIIESSIINVQSKTAADAQTSGSDDVNSFSKESTTVDTSGIENNPKPLTIVDVTDGSTKQEGSPKQTMGDEKQSNKEKERKEEERKPEEDVKEEKSERADKQEAEKKDFSEDILTKSTDVFNMQLGAILDLMKDDDKDTKTQTVL